MRLISLFVKLIFCLINNKVIEAENIYLVCNFVNIIAGAVEALG